MKFYTFGNQDNPSLLLLPGTCCTWKRNYETVIPMLEQDFYVICVSYDGFDDQEDTIFPDMLTETEQIENYIREHLGGSIYAAYGCSMGGSFVGLLAQRQVIHMDHGILGSSDLDQEEGLSARFKAWLIARVLHSIFQKGQLPGFFRKRLEAKEPEQRAYMEKLLSMFGVGDPGMAFVKRKSIRNQFYSDLVTPLQEGIDVQGTMLHIFYATKMGEQYLERYEKHFKHPVIHRHDLQHEELLVSYPEEWVEEVKCSVEV